MSDNTAHTTSASSDPDAVALARQEEGIGHLRILVGPAGPAGRLETHVAAALKRICDAKTFAYGCPASATQGDADYIVDPTIQNFDDLLALLPTDWRPDYVINLCACQNAILPGMEQSPIPLVGVICDWDRTLDKIEKFISAYDCVFVGEARAVPILKAMGCRSIYVQPIIGYEPALYEDLPDEPRVHDICFIGGIDGQLWRRRGAYLERLAALADRRRVYIRSGIYDELYIQTLAASKIVFNCPVRGEVNARCFEAMAAGALLLTEDNHAVREVFSDRTHCVLYNDENLEELIEFYLTHDEERETIASAGRAAVRLESYEARSRRLLIALDRIKPTADPASRPFLLKRPVDRHLALSVAAMVTNQWVGLSEREARAAIAEGNGSPEPSNNLGCILVHQALREAKPAARMHCFREAEAAFIAALDAYPDYAMAMLNLAALYQASDRSREAIALLQRMTDALIRDEIGAMRWTGMVVTASEMFQNAWQLAIFNHLTQPFPALARERARLLQWAGLTALGDLCKKLRNFSEAASCYVRAVRLAPDDAASKRELGLLAAQSDDIHSAIRYMERASEAVPLYAPGWYDLARFYVEANLLDKAKRHIARCVAITQAIPQLVPGIPEFDEMRAKLAERMPSTPFAHTFTNGEAA